MDLHRVLAELTDRIDQAVLGWEVFNLLSKSSSPYNISSRERIRWISCILNVLLWNSPNIYLTLGILDLSMYRWCGTKNQVIRFATLCFLSQLKKKQTPNQAFGNSPDQPTLLLLRTPTPSDGGLQLTTWFCLLPGLKHQRPGSIMTFTHLRDDTPDSCARVKGLRDMIVNGLKEKVKVL